MMAEQVRRLDSFRLLLNEISYHLTEKNLQSLIHICNVPGGMTKQMNDGLALFNYMITQDFISREKIGNLRNLMRKVRPRRKDLVRLVDEYIKKEFETDDVRSVLDDFSESWEEIKLTKRESPILDDEEAVFKIDCSYFNCVCRRVPSCYAPIVVILLFAIIVTAVFWYADVPRISSSITQNPDLHKAGVYILLLEILAILVVIGLCFRQRLASCLPCRKLDYGELVNQTIQEDTDHRIVNSTSTGRLQSMASAPRPYRISHSESGAFSYASGDPGSTSTLSIHFGTFEPTGDMPCSSGTEA